jgi:2-iminobutanoate/2-iminopropanoate deaminase
VVRAVPSRKPKKLVAKDKLGRPSRLYSQAVTAGGFAFVSAQVSNDPETKEFIGGDIKKQTEQAMRNVLGVLRALGLDFSDVVKVNVYLQDMSDFEGLNEAYPQFFEGDVPPARTVTQSAFPRKDERVKIEAVAKTRS